MNEIERKLEELEEKINGELSIFTGKINDSITRQKIAETLSYLIGFEVTDKTEYKDVDLNVMIFKIYDPETKESKELKIN